MHISTPPFDVHNQSAKIFFARARCLSAGLRSWGLLADHQGIEPPPAVCHRRQERRPTNWATGTPAQSIWQTHLLNEEHSYRQIREFAEAETRKVSMHCAWSPFCCALFQKDQKPRAHHEGQAPWSPLEAPLKPPWSLPFKLPSTFLKVISFSIFQKVDHLREFLQLLRSLGVHSAEGYRNKS